MFEPRLEELSMLAIGKFIEVAQRQAEKEGAQRAVCCEQHSERTQWPLLVSHQVSPGQGRIQGVRAAGIGLAAKLCCTDLDGHGLQLRSSVACDSPLHKAEITGTIGRERAGEPGLLL